MSAIAGRGVRALVAHSPDRRSVSPVEALGPGPGEVWIETSYSGVSTGTDGWVITGRFAWGGHAFPLVPGYQRAGIITELGPGVEGFQVGQAVVSTTTRGLVDHTAGMGAHLSGGASPADDTYDATGISARVAALFISAQVGYNAASRIRVGEGSPVVVIGDGIIGASAALFAASRGFPVLLVGRHEERLEVIRSCGIEVVHTADAAAAIGRWGPEAVIDTVQTVEAAHSYLPALPQRRGEVVFSGHSPDGVLTWGDMAMMQQRELTARFVSGWTRDRIETTLQSLRSGAVPFERLIGRVAETDNEIDTMMAAVAAGQLVGVARVVGWGASPSSMPVSSAQSPSTAS